ncbi:cytochrome P450 6B2-like [Plodia interpunctella]|uniref:cytochrome P450 6B2-like n=1 Tax=Plodia interpunctella TaxID=58824 RepID=UPI0023675774|nr:cytochrome P450 6B2-like [Plodia interpunctella]
MIPFILFFVTVITILYYYSTRTLRYWKNKNVKGPEPMALFGNYYEMARRRKFIGEISRDAYNQFPNEKVIGMYTMVTPILLVKDLDIIKQILIKDFDVFTDRGTDFSKDGLGANLFHADGDTWRVLRNYFTPLFTSGKLKNMTYLMTERADMFLEHIDKIVRDQPEQEVHKLIQKFTISSISACAFGIDMDIEQDHEFMKSITAFDKLIFDISYFIEIIMVYPDLMKKFNTSLFPKAIVNFFYDLVRKVVNDRKGVPIGRKDFMDLILELKQQGEIKGTRRSDEKELQLDFNEDVMAGQAFAFYVAGYETSATAMTFMLYELARNVNVQDKILAEIDEVLERHNGKITYDSISDLKYMEKAFDETLRMYPVLDSLQRRAQCDYKFPDLDLKIEKGQVIFISPLAIHRDPNNYPDPDRFDPERFNPENVRERHPCAYIPFGLGPRNCIGMRFAKVQSRVCMMRLLSKYRVEMSEKTPRQVKLSPLRLIASPYGGMPLKIVPRRQ